jgi:hypothetical protein
MHAVGPAVLTDDHIKTAYNAAARKTYSVIQVTFTRTFLYDRAP